MIYKNSIFLYTIIIISKSLFYFYFIAKAGEQIVGEQKGGA